MQTQKKLDPYVIVVILLLHVGATFIFLPPWEAFKNEPLYFMDHAVHTHRVHMYRQGWLESGLPWGYDPAISAGTYVDPFQDVGAKAQQIFSAIFFFLSTGMAYRLFTFLAVLTFPLWIYLVSRRLNLPLGAQAWILVTLIGPAWLFRAKPFLLPRYLEFGLVSYLAAGFYAPHTLMLFIDFIMKPRVKSYLYFCLSSSLLMSLHVLGLVPLVPAIGIFTLFAGTLAWRWRFASLASPIFVVGVNLFWFLPLFICYFWLPAPPWPYVEELNWGRDLTFESWSQLRKYFSFSRSTLTAIMGVFLAGFGLFRLRKMVPKPVVLGFSITFGATLFIFVAGSFVPVLVRFQPARFIIPLLAFSALPIGIALYAFLTKLKLPPGLAAGAFAILVSIVATLEGDPRPLEVPRKSDPLAQFIKNETAPDERLMIQEQEGGDHRCKILPFTYNREIIGTTRPVSAYDPAQFLAKTVFGKKITSWSPPEFMETVQRWGVTWVFTYRANARDLLEKVVGGTGTKVGEYYAFQIPGLPKKFLVGAGKIFVEGKSN